MYTKEQYLNADYFEHKTWKNADNTPARYRRNGANKTWKTRPDEFKIPVKRGMREYGYIDQDNYQDFIPV